MPHKLQKKINKSRNSEVYSINVFRWETEARDEDSRVPDPGWKAEGKKECSSGGLKEVSSKILEKLSSGADFLTAAPSQFNWYLKFSF